MNAPAAAWPADRRLATALALPGGAALVLSFAPVNLALLAPLPLCLLLLLLEGRTPGQAARLGFAFGIGLFTAGTYWLYVSLNIMGGLWPPLALLLMACLIAATSLFVACAAYLTVRLVPDGHVVWRGMVAFPAAWVLTEWARGWMATGFPWLSLGYGQIELPHASLAPVAGVYGVTFLTVWLAGCLYVAVRGGSAMRVAAGLLVLIALTGLHYLDKAEWTQDTGRELRVGLVQGAVPQERKWLPEQLEPTLMLYRDLSLRMANRDLIVWPEAAIPALPFEVAGFIDSMRSAMIERNTQLLTGILTYRPDEGRFFNTLWAIGAETGQYHKRHLVMFGEYFPLPDFARRWLRIMNLPSENIAAGAADQPLLTAKGVPVAATICYELAFGAEQLGFFPAAQLLVNVSNDAWFGDTIAPHQHLQIGRMRARETGRWLVRATNTGITAVVAPSGSVVAQIPQFEPGVIEATVRPRSGLTPYIRWGNYPVIGLALWCILAALVRSIARTQRRRT